MAAVAPIASPYNEKIRPLLDVIDSLRHLKVMHEGIPLPTIVVVGDQSSGKSSILESLAQINLPRGLGICTRVPLIMRLQSSSQLELSLEYAGKIVPTDEQHVCDAITLATNHIAGKGKGISNNPLTLLVKKKGVPDLTMVDLPGITRVPVPGQPHNIYELISEIIMEYITPEESIILNVLSAAVDFSTCESIRMSREVDKSGQRTLAVVTKVDQAPGGLLEKVTSDGVDIGLGYVCVRNRIGDESYDVARSEEEKLFKENPLLEKISKSMVGLDVLALRLVGVQATLIEKCLPHIVTKIDDKLSSNMDELDKLPRILTSTAEAVTALVHVLGDTKESLKKILLTAEFGEFPDDKDMHCTARLAEMLNEYLDELQGKNSNEGMVNFFVDEIGVLEETKCIGRPNFMPRVTFITLLQKKVKGITGVPYALINKFWCYIEEVVLAVLMKQCENYPQLVDTTKGAARSLISMKKQQSEGWVNDMLEMEKLTDYTCDPEYMSLWSKLMEHQNDFMDAITDHSKPSLFQINGFGNVDIEHLRGQAPLAGEAFDLKMRLTAYWKIVLKRMVDCMALHLMFNVHKLVKEVNWKITEELMGADGKGLELMLEESPSIAAKRMKLSNSIERLKEAKNLVAKTMEQMSSK